MSKKPDYTALDPTKQEIRLLRVHAGSPHDTTDILQCDLFVADLLDQELQYDALSYCWGDPSPRQTIIVNGREVEVGPSLGSALRHLRHRNRELVIWADAVCIDQSSIQEKNHQVGQMGNVYSKARTVRVWLGEGRFDEELPLDVLRKLEIIFRSQARFKWDHQSLHDIFGELENSLSNGSKDAMFDFCHSWYWKRTWVFQELALAKASCIHYGHHHVSFQELLETSRILDFYLVMMFVDEHDLDVNLPSLNSFETLWRSRMYEMLAAIHRSRTELPRTSLTDLRQVSFMSQQETTDPRDKIYALAGLFARGQGLTTDHINPDYGKSVESAYMDFARYLVETGLVFECLQLSGLCKTTDQTSEIPDCELQSSWVQDWRLNHTSFPFTSVACDPPQGGVVGRVVGSSLWVEAKEVDTVMEVTCVRLDLAEPLTVSDCLAKDLLETMPRYVVEFLEAIFPGADMPSGESRLHCLVRLFAADRYFHPHLLCSLQTARHDIFRASAERNMAALESGNVDQAGVVHFHFGNPMPVRLIDEDDLNTALPADGNTVGCAQTRVLTAQNLQSSRVFLTKHGLMGIGSARIREGDLICCLKPSDAVFALSPQGGKDEGKIWYKNAGLCFLPDLKTTPMENYELSLHGEKPAEAAMWETNSTDSWDTIDDDDDDRPYVDVEIR